MADLSITAANVQKSTGAQLETGVAGVAIAAGQSLYKDTTDSNKMKLADANLSELAATLEGVSLHAAAAGQPITYITAGNYNPGATVAAGAVYVLSGTAGGIAPVADLTTGWRTSIVGIGTSTSNIRLLKFSSGVAVG